MKLNRPTRILLDAVLKPNKVRAIKPQTINRKSKAPKRRV
jgi:hypothetical protein